MIISFYESGLQIRPLIHSRLFCYDTIRLTIPYALGYKKGVRKEKTPSQTVLLIKFFLFHTQFVLVLDNPHPNLSTAPLSMLSTVGITYALHRLLLMQSR